MEASSALLPPRVSRCSSPSRSRISTRDSVNRARTAGHTDPPPDRGKDRAAGMYDHPRPAPSCPWMPMRSTHHQETRRRPSRSPFALQVQRLSGRHRAGSPILWQRGRQQILAVGCPETTQGHRCRLGTPTIHTRPHS